MQSQTAEVRALSAAAQQPSQEFQDLMARPVNATGAATLIMNDQGAAFDRMEKVARLMASGRSTIPKHLQGSQADCMAIVLQAVQWNMNPWAIAQKTHVTQGGQLGYEAQLVNAVVIGSGAIDGRPEFKFIGEWEKILGKVEEKTGSSGGKYYVKSWKEADEAGLGVVCSVRERGEAAPREITVMLSQCWPRFSTQWATDPQQQIAYLSLRKLVRRYFPDVLLGVYTTDELEGVDLDPPDGNVSGSAAEQSAGSRAGQAKAKLMDRAEQTPPAAQNIDGVLRQIQAAETPEQMESAKAALLALQDDEHRTHAKKAWSARLKALKSQESQERNDAPAAGSGDQSRPAADMFGAQITYAEVAEKIQKAATVDDLDVAADMIGAVADQGQRTELTEMYHARQSALAQ